MAIPSTTNADYFTFNVHHSLLLAGQTGSGKSELVRRYIQRLERAFTPEQMQYVIYDLKQVEFNTNEGGGVHEEYLYAPVMTGTSEDMSYLEELANLAESRAAGDEPKDKMIFIYVEECDMAYAYPDRFTPAVLKINRHVRQANMKFVFSSSKPSRDYVTPEFRDSFELILTGRLASKYDEETLGVSHTQDILFPYEFVVKETAVS